MSTLSDYCVYTIALPWRLVEASREGTPLAEGRRWVTGRQLLKRAKSQGIALPVLLADSRDCSKLIAWTVLKEIKVGPAGTRFTIGRLWALRRRRPQELRLKSSGKHIAADFIRPYAVCHTPEFLRRAAKAPSPYQYGQAPSPGAGPGRRRLPRLNVRGALRRAWPAIVKECRQVLGSELHYQAMVYHCLRTEGRIPIGQLGMNVKMWIDDVTTKRFRRRDRAHKPGYRGGFEPIPDVVVFSRGVRGDWRRRKNKATLQHMVGAIEIKASERAQHGLSVKEVTEDIEKIADHRAEKRYKWNKGFYAAVMVVDTAPKDERMTREEVDDVISAARANRVDAYYMSKDVANPPVK